MQQVSHQPVLSAWLMCILFYQQHLCSGALAWQSRWRLLRNDNCSRARRAAWASLMREMSRNRKLKRSAETHGHAPTYHSCVDRFFAGPLKTDAYKTCKATAKGRPSAEAGRRSGRSACLAHHLVVSCRSLSATGGGGGPASAVVHCHRRHRRRRRSQASPLHPHDAAPPSLAGRQGAAPSERLPSNRVACGWMWAFRPTAAQ